MFESSFAKGIWWLFAAKMGRSYVHPQIVRYARNPIESEYDGVNDPIAIIIGDRKMSIAVGTGKIPDAELRDLRDELRKLEGQPVPDRAEPAIFSTAAIRKDGVRIIARQPVPRENVICVGDDNPPLDSR